MIDYESLMLDAQRGVVRAVLRITEKKGLLGDHHFYICFDTQAPNVSMSKRLREKYPTEMTIVLQHRFWELMVFEDRFEVKLTFDSIPERLVIPFVAVKAFFDPSVNFGFRFIDDSDATHEPGTPGHDLPGADDSVDGRGPMTTRSTSQRKPRSPRKPRGDKDMASPSLLAPHDPAPATPLKAPAPRAPAAPIAPQPASDRVPQPAPAAAKDATDRPQAPHLKPVPQTGGGAQVVSLDAFRKK